MNRERLLEELRRVQQEEPVELPTSLPAFPKPPNLVARFQQQLEAAGGIFLHATSVEELQAALTRILSETGAEKILWESSDVFERHGLQTTDLSRQVGEGWLVTEHPARLLSLPLTPTLEKMDRQALAAVELSASSAVAGVASTGSVVERSGSGRGRLLSVLPPAHIVFLRQQDLLENQGQLFEGDRLKDQGSAVTIVTGPSRTADIEKTLILGVHGPGKLYVVITSG